MRVFALVLGTANLAVLLLLITLYAVTVPRNVGDARWTDWLIFALLTGIYILVWYAVGVLAYVFIGIAASGTWLCGTRLRQRAGLRRTSVDLRTGDVRLDEGGTTLVATGPGRRATIRVTLRAGHLTLPPAELMALAGALGDNGAADVGSHLRTMAGEAATLEARRT